MSDSDDLFGAWTPPLLPNGLSVLYRLFPVGTVGVRDPLYPCELYDGKRYDGTGTCDSDGHYECVNCSHLSPQAPRFTETREGRADRLRLYWIRRSGHQLRPSWVSKLPSR